MTSDRATSVLQSGLRSLRPVLATAFVFSFFINILLFVTPLYMLQIYDRVLSSRSEATLVGVSLIAAFALAVYSCLEMLRARILVRGGVIFDQAIATPIYDAVHRSILRRPGSGQDAALRDLDVLREFLTGSGLLAFCDAPWTPIFLLACFALHPWFGWMALAGGSAILALTLVNEVATRRLLDAANRASHAAAQQARASARNAEVLHAMGMVAAVRELWRAPHQDVLMLQARASDRAGLIVAATKYVRMLLQTMVLGLGAYLAIRREISAGSMIAASIIIGRALAPIEAIVAHWKGVTAARASYRRLADLVSAAGAEPRRMSLPRPRGEVEIENASVAAPGGAAPILRGVSVRIEAGSVVGIVGPSASGKSTLARALTGVWPLLGGTVRIDGAEIGHWDPQALGRYLGYLPQDVELLDGTVAETIARFAVEDEGAIVEVARRAGCHALIQALPDGYNTRIGPGGHGLSGGQRQRIALARAMYGAPSLVVLDEPNASLDQAGEAALIQAVADLKRHGATVILITHKLGILAGADQVLVMNEGRVQAFGAAEPILAQLTGGRPLPASAPAAIGDGVVDRRLQERPRAATG
ncbi:type I secretion system ATPase [Methylobacterium sp. 4-46]|uniref:type I secretion system permease/ATPase n=1 Tax=unclassified Methylobacterium TaxID=2615210 RepID=UPI000152BEB1|nr:MULTISPECIES: type I secretion system permease/ATPase [Methylobacterium]ACA15794.1 type I secretion system ATPase [Methylobacterium sp. 4-46]WFT81524.1 type I secretion system permease/ATPase [Methylobacterium nodulans]